MDCYSAGLPCQKPALARQGAPACGAPQEYEVFMTEPLIVHRYWITDERMGIRRLTSVHLSAYEAARRHPGAEPEPSSRERHS